MKRKLRTEFRELVFERDDNRCRVCGQPDLFYNGVHSLSAHHIVDRHDMPNGGYVPENGIALCGECHWKAEAEHMNLTPEPGYSRQELFELIGTTFDEAWDKSEALR